METQENSATSSPSGATPKNLVRSISTTMLRKRWSCVASASVAPAEPGLEPGVRDNAAPEKGRGAKTIKTLGSGAGPAR
ncbi:MAG: hypothetical protein DRN30_06970 [Thermoplasmata archaeon]|nr:MAG: hypothetical protein DRN30_06970 [Thermoplasmata archaeon]